MSFGVIAIHFIELLYGRYTKRGCFLYVYALTLGGFFVCLLSVFDVAGQVGERVDEEIEKINYHDAQPGRQSRADRGEKEGA